MTALRTITSNDTAPNSAVFDAIGEAVLAADGYVDIAMRAVELRDGKALSYSLRCASAALVTAAEMAAELRPPHRGGSRS